MAQTYGSQESPLPCPVGHTPLQSARQEVFLTETRIIHPTPEREGAAALLSPVWASHASFRMLEPRPVLSLERSAVSLCGGVQFIRTEAGLLLSVVQRGNVAHPTLTFLFCLLGPSHSTAVSRLFCFFFLSDCFHSSCQVSSVALMKDVIFFK